MKLPEKYIEDLIKELGDQGALPLVFLIKDKQNVSEFKIAEKMNTSVNIVRRLLYFLSEHNLVSFTRKKDKKKGWYIYFWTFDSVRALNLIIELKQKKVQSYHQQTTLEQKENYFKCKNNCVRLTETEALEAEFKCFECGELLVREENKTKKLDDIQRKITGLSTELQELQTLRASIQRPLEAKPEKKEKKVKKKVKIVKLKKKIKKVAPTKAKQVHRLKKIKKVAILPQKKLPVPPPEKKGFNPLRRFFFRRKH